MSSYSRTRSLANVGIAAVAALVVGGVTALPARADGNEIKPDVPHSVSAAAEVTTDQFIVRIKEKAGPAAAAASEAALNAAARTGVPASRLRQTAAGAQVVKTDRALAAREAEGFLAALRADPDVVYAEPDAVMQPASVDPNDDLYSLQWDLWEDKAGLRVPGAWAVSRGEGVVVAVVDTGILGHSELDANVLPGYDMLSDASMARDGDSRDADPTDEGDWVSAGQCTGGDPASVSSWHGTHVAGTIAAVGNNGTGVTGVAPAAKILPLRALGPCGGYTSDIADSIVWAAGGVVAGAPVNPNPARVINLSLGGIAPCSATYQNAINFAYNSGAAVVVAAGNSNRPAVDSSPANCQNVITVAASGRTGARAPYSNYGSAVDVTAPGGDMSLDVMNGILSTSNFGDAAAAEEAYAFQQGTSMAAPHVAGVAALISSELGQRSTPAIIEDRLKTTARRAGGPCIWPVACWSTIVDAAAALNFQFDVPTIAGTPTIAGLASVGHTLTASPGTWTPQGVAFSHQWKRDGTDITGATTANYTVAPADLGAKISVLITGARPFMDSVSATSATTAKVIAGTITGPVPQITESLGQWNTVTLTVNPGVWEPVPVALSYQWMRSGEAIPGATGTSYVKSLADVGHGISVQVTGTKVGFESVQRTSAATAVPPITETPIKVAVVPAPVTFEDHPGTELDSYSIPDGGSAVEYLISGSVIAPGTYPGAGLVTVKAQATANYALSPDAVAEWSHTFKATPLQVSPAAVVFTDKDGTAEDTYTVPAVEGVEYLVGDKATEAGTYPGLGTVTVKARAKADYVLSAGTVTEWTHTFKATPYTVTPAAVVFTDKDGTKEDTFTIPAAEGVEYLVGDKVTGAGTYPGSGIVQVKARAMTDYVLAQGATAEWTATFLTTSAAYEPPAISPFSDVATGQQFYKEMAWLAEQGISTGWTEGGSRTYRPFEPISRDAMAAFLYRMAGKPEYTPPVVSPFTDIAPGQQFYKEMAWLAEQGISTGWTDAGSRTYRPFEPISRDAMAAFLYRMAGKPEYTAPVVSPFTDIAPGQQFYKEMSWLAENRISTGWSGDGGSRFYRPLQPISRDAMAAFLFRLNGLMG
jgi:serine protease